MSSLRGRTAGIVVCALLLFAGAARAEPSHRPRIIDGTPSPASQDYVVLIVQSVAAGFEQICSGSLIAPNLVLTARHCVSETPGDTFVCSEQGVGSAESDFGPDYTAANLQVFAGTNAPIAGSTPDAVGVEIFHDTSTTACNHDLALVAIDPPLTAVPTATLALYATPNAHAVVTSVGWGITQTGEAPAVRQERSGVPILAIGPSASAEDGTVGSNEFSVSESICQGDSGGPAVDPSGAVVGVASRGGNPTELTSSNAAAKCVGQGITNLYTEVAPFAPVIQDAARAVGATLTVSEIPLGDSCASSTQCTSGLCAVVDPGESPTCTVSCESEACETGSICDKSTGVGYCKPGSVGSGCREASSGQGGTDASLAPVLLGLVALARRKRRSGEAPPL